MVGYFNFKTIGLAIVPLFCLTLYLQNKWRRRWEKKLRKKLWKHNNKTKQLFLIGAGPGDGTLISKKGYDLLGEADYVFSDRLVSVSLTNYAEQNGAVIYNVGKSKSKNRFSQSQLESELIALLRECENGSVVVRLKGGDPFVFGLGGNECLAVREANIPNVECFVIPGISSSIGIPTTVGVPLTQKNYSNGFIVLSGHYSGELSEALEWVYLPNDITFDRCVFSLVVLMCGKHLGKISQFLLFQKNWANSLPAMLVKNGTMSTEEKITHTTVGELSRFVSGEGDDDSPTLLIIGRSCALDLGVSRQFASSINNWSKSRNDNNNI